MAVSTRHLHRQNLREASNENDDTFKEEGPHSGVNHHWQPPPQWLMQSHAVLDALSDENSELARFLFVRRGGNKEGNDGGSSWFSRFCHNISAGNSSDDVEMPSMGMYTNWCALSLEPMKIRNE